MRLNALEFVHFIRYGLRNLRFGLSFDISSVKMKIERGVRTSSFRSTEHARTDTVQELPRTVPYLLKYGIPTLLSFTHLCHMKVVWEMLFYDVMIWSHPQLFQQIEIEILEKMNNFEQNLDSLPYLKLYPLPIRNPDCHTFKFFYKYVPIRFSNLNFTPMISRWSRSHLQLVLICLLGASRLWKKRKRNMVLTWTGITVPYGTQVSGW